ncbi:MAG: carboxypeptidase regulatory-like domain-containing protein [Acidobacteria bacterium]|nr:carboxypeptidase regulatory-like domain-containing protein [Acidobacteriota bacterium]
MLQARLRLAWALLAAFCSFAQVLPVGTVDGTVTDSSGAALPAIKVTLRNLDTGVARDTTTNDSGYYFFPLVNPGRYESSVEKAGFKRGVQELTVRTGIRSTADFRLEVGQVTDSIQQRLRSRGLHSERGRCGRVHRIHQRAGRRIRTRRRHVRECRHQGRHERTARQRLQLFPQRQAECEQFLQQPRGCQASSVPLQSIRPHGGRTGGEESRFLVLQFRRAAPAHAARVSLHGTHRTASRGRFLANAERGRRAVPDRRPVDHHAGRGARSLPERPHPRQPHQLHRAQRAGTLPQSQSAGRSEYQRQQFLQRSARAL